MKEEIPISNPQDTQIRTSIVVGVDFFASSDLALTRALMLAQNTPNTELHVVHVVTERDLYDMGFGERMEQQNAALETLPEEVWKHLIEVGERISKNTWKLDAHVHIRLGETASAIHQVAVDYNATMIILGTQGKTGLERFVLGSVAETLMRNARCSVLVVRQTDYGGLEKSPKPIPSSPQEKQNLGTEQSKPRQSHLYNGTQEISWTRPTPTGMRIV